MQQLHPPKNKKFILQKDVADCGVVCLQNILLKYKLELSLERLRELSGTDAHGTTLLGLSHAAQELGFQAQGVEAGSIQDLTTLTHPCILHIFTKDNTQHYIIYYGWNGKKFVFGDPAKGIIELTPEEVAEVWKRKILLLLAPTEKLEAAARQYTSRWRWFYTIAKKYLPAFVITAVVGLVASLLNLSTAIFSQQLVDKLLVHPDTNKIFTGIALLTILLLFKAGITYIRSLIVSRQSNKFNIDIVGNFYSRLLQMPKSFFENRKTGDMVARLNDTNRIQQVVSMLVGEVSIQVIMLMVATIILFIYSWICGVIGLLFIPFAFLLVKKFQTRIINGQKTQLAAYSKNESNYIDNIKGIGIIKLFNRESFFFQKAKGMFTDYQGALLDMSVIRIRFNATIDILASVFLAALISVSVLQILQNQLKVGELVAIIQLGAVVMQMSISIALTNIQLQEARVAFDRMYEFISTEKEDKNVPPMENDETISIEVPLNIEAPLYFESLEAERLSFHFPGRRLLIQSASFSVSRGEIVAITGESGQGKSTLFQILQKFYTQGTGSISVNNQSLHDIDTKQWRRVIGVVTQEPALFSGTVLDNIQLNNCEEQDIINIVSFCQQTGLHEYISKFPQGYYTTVGEGGINISGGQKQLVCLARCLYHHPQLLLLDEPTAAMDKKTEAFVINLLQQYSTEAGIIVISHKDALIDIADVIYKLEQGFLHPMKEAIAQAV